MAVDTPVSKEWLQPLVLMNDVDIDALWPTLQNCSVRTLQANDVLLTPLSPRCGIFIVLEGYLRIHLEEVEDEPILMIGPGEGVGELSLFVDAPRSAYVVANEKCSCLYIPRDAFWTLLEISHRFTLNYLQMLSQRLRHSNRVLLENRALQEMYKQHAMTDGLTGLYNRRWFDEVYPNVFERSRRDDTPLCVVMLDIDHFKDFNDNHGHQAGDFALFMVAQILKTQFRTSDVVARYGGEEFVVLMPNTLEKEAVLAAERVRKVVAQRALELPSDVRLEPVHISLRVAQRSAAHQEASTLLLQADEALYRAKNTGRNKTSV